jgi:hypothetical protein
LFVGSRSGTADRNRRIAEIIGGSSGEVQGTGQES